LKVVVCTSSFDLGVDFPAVEQVVQIGSPKGLARFVQRAGRSGHRPGATPRIVCVPTHAIELAEFSAAREALSRGEIEPRAPLEMPFDVLVQHVVTLASGAGLDPEATFDEVRRTHAFRDLGRDDWEWVLDFAGRGGATLAAYPQFARLVERDGRFWASSDRIAALHRVNIGTIVAEGTVEVRMERGGRLGEVEESFASRRKPGEQIRFAGRALEVVSLNGMRLTVRRARNPSDTAEAPRWMGAKMPLSSHLGRALRRELARPASEWSSRRELAALAPLLSLQQERSRLPGPDEVLIELSEMRGQHMACVFPFEGRNVHEGLSALVAWRLAQQRASSLSTTVTDYAFALQSRHPFPDDPTVWPALLSPDDLEQDLAALLAGTDYARRQFRYVARVAGLLVQGWPGQKRRLRDLQASSSLIHAVFERYDPTNRLLVQARREVLEHEFELTRLRSALERMASSTWNVVVLDRLSPLSFPLWAEWSRGEVSTEAWEDRVQRMALAQEDGHTSAPIPAAPARRRAWR
jgi:ATP-dependent Lhr-like helicase